jgi:hypothetical protein
MARGYFILRKDVVLMRKDLVNVKKNSQFAALNHVAHDNDMTVAANCQEDARNRKKREHLLAGFRTRGLPSFHTSVHALRELVGLGGGELVDIKPCDITVAFPIGLAIVFLA